MKEREKEGKEAGKETDQRKENNTMCIRFEI